MHKHFLFAAFFVIAILFAAAAPLTPGNIVVLRFGDGTSTLTSSATPVFLDEYTPGGVLIQSIAMPTSAVGNNYRLTCSGSSSSEGSLNLSANRYFLSLTGYDADPGTATVANTNSATVKRVLGLVSASGNINTTTALTDAYNGNSSIAGNIRGAVTYDGTAFWTAGTGSSAAGTRYAAIGATSSTAVAGTPDNVRNLSIYNNQLYISSGIVANRGVNTVGNGMPTSSGQTATLLPGMNYTTQTFAESPYAFEINPLRGNTLYIADDGAGNTSLGGGIQKWVLANGAWTYSYTIVPAANYIRGLTVDWSAPEPVIYAVYSPLSGNSRLYKIIDKGSDGTSIKTLLLTAAPNTAFKGIAFTPGTVLLPLQLLSFTASPQNGQLVFNWKTLNEQHTRHFEIEESSNGTDFHRLATTSAAGNTTAEKNYTYSGSLNNTTRFYRLKMVDTDGQYQYSPVIKIAAITHDLAFTKVYPVPAKNKLTVAWNSNHTGNTSIQLTDMSGRMIKTLKTLSAKGLNQQTIDIQMLSTGSYLLQIIQAGSQIQMKISKQ